MTFSIRQRLTLWYFLVLLAGFALFGTVMWSRLEKRLIGGVDARLAQRFRGLEIALKSETDLQDPGRLQQEIAEFSSQISDGTLIQFRDHSGTLLLPNPRQIVFQPPKPPFPPTARTPVTTYTTEPYGKPFRVLSVPFDIAGESWDVIVASPLEDVFRVLNEIRQMASSWATMVLVLSCLGGYLLIGRALRPVDEITVVARSISLQNLSQRIAVPPTRDELQRMADTWNQVLQRLDAAVQRIRRFTADASHELRSPLALVRATAELTLRKERSSEEYRRALREIQNQAEVMTALTESMLLIARADFEGFDMPLAPTDLNALVASEGGQNAVAVEKGVRLSVATDPQVVSVQANGPGIQSLLRILIENAVRHTPAGGTVTVSTVRRESAAILTVADTGEGIAATDLPHIFDRFYRADPARAAGSGFGLGLSIAQAIAQAHRSAITVESTPGAGSRFSLALRM